MGHGFAEDAFWKDISVQGFDGLAGVYLSVTSRLYINENNIVCHGFLNYKESAW